MSVRDREFPVIVRRDNRGRVLDNCPESVPWTFVDGHQEQAMANHGQTLERIAERGGLAPCELYAVVNDRRRQPMPYGEAVAWLRGAATEQAAATA